MHWKVSSEYYKPIHAEFLPAPADHKMLHGLSEAFDLMEMSPHTTLEIEEDQFPTECPLSSIPGQDSINHYLKIANSWLAVTPYIQDPPRNLFHFVGRKDSSNGSPESEYPYFQLRAEMTRDLDTTLAATFENDCFLVVPSVSLVFSMSRDSYSPEFKMDLNFHLDRYLQVNASLVSTRRQEEKVSREHLEELVEVRRRLAFAGKIQVSSIPPSHFPSTDTDTAS